MLCDVTKCVRWTQKIVLYLTDQSLIPIIYFSLLLVFWVQWNFNLGTNEKCTLLLNRMLVLHIYCCVVGVNIVGTEQRLWVWYWLCAEYSEGAVDSRTDTRTVLTQKLLLNVQLHNRTVQLMSTEVECSRLLDITSTYADFGSSKNSHDSKRTATISQC